MTIPCTFGGIERAEHQWIKGKPRAGEPVMQVCPFCGARRSKPQTEPPPAVRRSLQPVLKTPRATTAPVHMPELGRKAFRTPEEHNAEIRRRQGPRTDLLNRDETVALYGWDAALELFPNP